MVLYHREDNPSEVYSSPLYLYTILSPIAMIGLCLVTDSILLIIIYIAPIALLLLIVLLNRGMKILTKPHLIFFIVEVIMIAVILSDHVSYAVPEACKINMLHRVLV